LKWRQRRSRKTREGSKTGRKRKEDEGRKEGRKEERIEREERKKDHS
jgi:hypothetical protein